MGIRGFDAFIKDRIVGKEHFATTASSNEQYMSQESSQQQIDLILVDAMSLFHHLWSESQHEPRVFLNLLHTAASTLLYLVPAVTVIMDGALPIEKLETRLRREREKIASKTSFMPSVYQSLAIVYLQQMNVNVVMAQYEADSEICSMTNDMDCNIIVLAQDSDYFVMDLGKNGRYAPLGQFSVGKLDDGYYFRMRSYHREEIARALKMKPEMLPLLVSILGNDYTEAWTKSKKDKSNVKSTVEWFHRVVNKDMNIIDAVEACLKTVTHSSSQASLSQQLQSSMIQYQQCSKSGIAKSNIGLSVDAFGLIDAVTSQSFYCKYYPEDVDQESIWKPLTTIRSFLFSFLLLDKSFTSVTEYRRSKTSYDAHKLDLLSPNLFQDYFASSVQILPPLPLNTCNLMKHDHDLSIHSRLSALFRLFEIPNVEVPISSNSLSDLCFLAAIRFQLLHSKWTEYDISSCLFTFLTTSPFEFSSSQSPTDQNAKVAPLPAIPKRVLYIHSALILTIHHFYITASTLDVFRSSDLRRALIDVLTRVTVQKWASVFEKLRRGLTVDKVAKKLGGEIGKTREELLDLLHDWRQRIKV